MNFDQLSSGIAKKTGLTKVQSKAAYEALVELVGEELNADPKAEEAKCTLPKLGTIKAKFAEAHEGFNPIKKEKMTIPASRRVYFSALKPLKDKVNEVL